MDPTWYDVLFSVVPLGLMLLFWDKISMPKWEREHKAWIARTLAEDRVPKKREP